VRSDVDVLIIGAGPTGLAAALELRRLGAGHVLVVDREERAGGVPRHAAHLGFGMLDLHRVLTGPRYAERYVHLTRSAGAEVRTGVTVTEWCGPTALRATSRHGVAEISARAVILATGCRERPRSARLVPGDRPAGVLTTGALQQLAHLRRAPVGREAVVVGAEHVSFSALLTLAHAGTKAVAMVTEHARVQSYPPLKWLSAGRLGVRILTHTRLTQIIGARRVEGVTLEDVGSGAQRRLACDTVVFTGDWIPDHELSRQGGLEIDPDGRGPRVDFALRTSRRGVFAAGNLLHGAERADVAALSGRHAARRAHAFLRTDHWPARPPVAVTCASPVLWASPSAIGVEPSAAPHGHFILRVGRFCGPGDFVASQEGRELWRERRRRLVPNRSIHLTADWAYLVDPGGGEVRVGFEEVGSRL